MKHETWRGEKVECINCAPEDIYIAKKYWEQLSTNLQPTRWIPLSKLQPREPYYILKPSRDIEATILKFEKTGKLMMSRCAFIFNGGVINGGGWFELDEEDSEHFWFGGREEVVLRQLRASRYDGACGNEAVVMAWLANGRIAVDEYGVAIVVDDTSSVYRVYTPDCLLEEDKISEDRLLYVGDSVLTYTIEALEYLVTRSELARVIEALRRVGYEFYYDAKHRYLLSTRGGGEVVRGVSVGVKSYGLVLNGYRWDRLRVYEGLEKVDSAEDLVILVSWVTGEEE